MFIDATVPLVDRAKQILSRQLKTSHITQVQVTSTILHSPHISALFVLNLKALSINGNRDQTLHPLQV